MPVSSPDDSPGIYQPFQSLVALQKIQMPGAQKIGEGAGYRGWGVEENKNQDSFLPPTPYTLSEIEVKRGRWTFYETTNKNS